MAGSTRASLYRLGDLVDWVREHAEAEVIFDPGWALLRGARSFAEEQQIEPGPGPRIAETVPLDRLRRFLVGVALLWASARESTSLRANVVEAVLQEGDDLPGRLCALAIRSGSGSDRLAEQLLSFVADALTRPRRGAAAAAVAMLESGEESPPSLAGFLFEHLAGLGARAGVTTTGQSLAYLVAALGRPGAGERVMDPACGEGQLLCATTQRAGDAELVGRDNDVGALLTAEAVLELNNVTADLDGGPTDSLDTGTDLGPADLVLLDPPLGGGRHVVRWLRLATELSLDGRAVVVLPGDALRRGRREWMTVAERVVAVIACPAGCAPIPERRRRCGCWDVMKRRTCWWWTPPHPVPPHSGSSRRSSWHRPSTNGDLGESGSRRRGCGAWRCRAVTSPRREGSFDSTTGRRRPREVRAPVPKSKGRSTHSSGIPSCSPRSCWNRSARSRIRAQRNLRELSRSS